MRVVLKVEVAVDLDARRVQRMIQTRDLRRIARARLRDAEVLRDAQRYDGSVYLCGYSVEIALKWRICRALKWQGFPATSKEFDGYQSFRTHNLDILLRMSSAEAKIKTQYLPEWSIVGTWDPNARYRVTGTATLQDSTDIVNAAKAIIRAL